MTRNFIVATLSLLVVAINFVSSQLTTDQLLPHNSPNFRHKPSLTRNRRMYALCPPEFTKIGNDCYYLSSKKESWLDAHFECKDRNSKLAEPLKFADRRLRKYLKNRDQGIDSKWIGGMFNWQLVKWQWGYNGADMKYQAFGDGDTISDLRYHCTAMDPQIEYKWSAKPCTDRHNFICQHRMSYVNEKNRQKVYTKWNETYPNQLANEVEVYVSTNGNSNRSLYRNVPKRNRVNPGKTIQLNNNFPKTELADNAPDYLPPSVYTNLEQLQQKAQEDVIHPVQSPHATNPKLPSMRPKKRHSKPLKLTGEVNLGNQFKHERRQRPKDRRKPVENRENSIVEEAVTNPVRHHHHIENEIEAVEEVPETTTPLEAATETVTESDLIDAIAKQTEDDKILAAETRKKLDEKAMRRERLKEKLSKLSPEQRQAFLLMKQQRADARKKGLLGNN